MKSAPDGFWPETMTRGGVTATREEMEGAWRDFPDCGPRYELARVIHKHRKRIGFAYPERLAGAMLQRARKAGLVRFESGLWVEVEQ